MIKKVIFGEKVYEKIEIYTRRYRLYYQDLFEDSGIWNRKQIIEGYQNESINRYSEIINAIKQRLINPVISYTQNETTIKWRSKTLLVSFYDEGDTRIITDLDIR